MSLWCLSDNEGKQQQCECVIERARLGAIVYYIFVSALSLRLKVKSLDIQLLCSGLDCDSRRRTHLFLGFMKTVFSVEVLAIYEYMFSCRMFRSECQTRRMLPRLAIAL